MTAVVLSRRLALDLQTLSGPEHPQAFAAEFQLWKDGGIGPGDAFGKNTPFIKPPEVVRCDLWKVHLEDASVTPRWNRLLEQGVSDPDAFTSDRLLVYTRLADLAYQPYLLLSIIDPAHPFMQAPQNVRQLATAYEIEREAFTKYYPGDPWIVVGMP